MFAFIHHLEFECAISKGIRKFTFFEKRLQRPLFFFDENKYKILLLESKKKQKISNKLPIQTHMLQV